MAGGCIEGILLIAGVREFLDIDPELLNEAVELLKPPFKKLEIILTGEGGLKDFDLSPSTCSCIDLRVLA